MEARVGGPAEPPVVGKLMMCRMDVFPRKQAIQADFAASLFPFIESEHLRGQSIVPGRRAPLIIEVAHTVCKSF